MNFLTKEPINKGWSNDKKYCITDKNGTQYLLRVSDLAEHDKKQSEFNMIKQVSALGVPMCQPIEFGVCDEGVYSIQSWIDGADAEEIIPTLSDTEQYVYGLEAGRILRKIHSIPAPAMQEDWEIRFNRKMDYKIKKYTECPMKYENGQAFIDYINENRYLLKDRPQTYQHGDYHIGNMMIGSDKKLYIIDFNRNDFGDPWEEFNRIVWGAQKSPIFASGNIAFYYLIEECDGCKIPDNGEFVSHKDNCNVVIGWMDIEELKSIIVYPEFLEEEIYDLDGEVKHFISK